MSYNGVSVSSASSDYFFVDGLDLLNELDEGEAVVSTEINGAEAGPYMRGPDAGGDPPEPEYGVDPALLEQDFDSDGISQVPHQYEQSSSSTGDGTSFPGAGSSGGVNALPDQSMAYLFPESAQDRPQIQRYSQPETTTFSNTEDGGLLSLGAFEDRPTGPADTSLSDYFEMPHPSPYFSHRQNIYSQPHGYPFTPYFGGDSAGGAQSYSNVSSGDLDAPYFSNSPAPSMVAQQMANHLPQQYSATDNRDCQDADRSGNLNRASLNNDPLQNRWHPTPHHTGQQAPSTPQFTQTQVSVNNMSAENGASANDNRNPSSEVPDTTTPTQAKRRGPKAQRFEASTPCFEPKCKKSFRPFKPHIKPQLSDEERKRCLRCREKWQRAQQRDVTPEFQYLPSEATYEIARERTFQSYRPVNIPADDFGEHEDKEVHWVQRFMDAVNLPWDSAPASSGIPDKDTAYYGQQQNILNQKPYQNPGKQWYHDEWINRRLVLLFYAAINFHKGGPRPYAHGGDNSGYGNADKKLKCSARLMEIERILQFDKRTAINVIEGRGGCAFAENPRQFAKRKVQNRSSNNTKKQQIEKGKSKGKATSPEPVSDEDSDYDQDDDNYDELDNTEQVWENTPAVEPPRNVNAGEGEGSSRMANFGFQPLGAAHSSGSSSHQSDVSHAQDGQVQQGESRKRKADSADVVLELRESPSKRGRGET